MTTNVGMNKSDGIGLNHIENVGAIKTTSVVGDANMFITVKPTEELLEKKVNTSGYPYQTGDMRLIDFVTLAGTRNSANNSYKGGDEEFQAINWPNLMCTLCEDLLGYEVVSSKGIYTPLKPIVYSAIDIQSTIEDLNKQLKNGYRLILMIDSDLIQDVWDYDSADYHWVVLEDLITFIPYFNSKGKIEYKLNFKVYTWGSNKEYLKAPITPLHFMNNYYGYIKVK
uniref:hypothetical protein n=1 Tax=Ornithobacterium rhinotracheale TaxID=28251 RepID=UPI0021A9F9F0|nr:hypothetical protein [Ornithobacterium rhinotracheale]